MLNYLQNISQTTAIALLPSVVNHNNEAITKEFAWIYDASLNRLIRDVYVPKGSVKAHFGEFVNLSVEYITVKNIDSLKNDVRNAVETYMNDDLDQLVIKHIGDIQTTQHQHTYIVNSNRDFEEPNSSDKIETELFSGVNKVKDVQEGMITYTNLKCLSFDAVQNSLSTPALNGNIINMTCNGGSQLFLEHKIGEEYVTGNVWYRSHADNELKGWTPWKRLVFAEEVEEIQNHCKNLEEKCSNLQASNVELTDTVQNLQKQIDQLNELISKNISSYNNNISFQNIDTDDLFQINSIQAD